MHQTMLLQSFSILEEARVCGIDSGTAKHCVYDVNVLARGSEEVERALRMDHVVDVLKREKLDYLMVGPSPDMEYLAGLTPVADERFKVLCVSKNGKHFAIAPKLCREEFEGELAPDIPVYVWGDDEGPISAIERAFAEYVVADSFMAMNDGIRAIDVIDLVERYRIKPRNGGELVAQLRQVKSPEEVECQRAVGKLADEVLYALEGYIRSGLTERDIQIRLRDEFEKRGGERVTWVIGSGPNGALPHNTKSDRVVEEHDVVIVDFGARYRGYRSDTTRTFIVGEPTEEQRRVYEIVLAAHLAGEAAVRPGVRACDVDKAARTVIEEAGYGKYFTHRTGHGIGIMVHELPNISASNTTVLESGMTFSIEPGIYLPGKFGVRIENCVVVTEKGAEPFTHYPRELRVI
jgi:Xaa-Pro aminopeptidase